MDCSFPKLIYVLDDCNIREDSLNTPDRFAAECTSKRLFKFLTTSRLRLRASQEGERVHLHGMQIIPNS